jgi:hypothetical protein
MTDQPFFASTVALVLLTGWSRTACPPRTACASPCSSWSSGGFAEEQANKAAEMRWERVAGDSGYSKMPTTPLSSLDS